MTGLSQSPISRGPSLRKAKNPRPCGVFVAPKLYHIILVAVKGLLKDPSEHSGLHRPGVLGYTMFAARQEEPQMYYPEDMTQEDIEAFERDMAEQYIREEYNPINWELQVIAQEA